MCFDRLVIFGALDLSLPFLATAAEADAFRQFAYAYLGLPPDPHSGPPPQLTPAPGEHSKDGLEVLVRASQFKKFGRCWHHTDDVG